MPLALALPSTVQLDRANQLLGEEIGHRQRAEAALRERMRNSSGAWPSVPQIFKRESCGGEIPRQHSVQARSAGGACHRAQARR
jgi:hypothetical protein